MVAVTVVGVLALPKRASYTVVRPPASPGPSRSARPGWRRCARRSVPVFAYFTADWCLTCKVNEKTAIETDATRTAFAKHDVAVLVGDWTDGDPTLGRFIQAHNRAGVPLYLYYAPGAAEPQVLPQVLTSGLLAVACGLTQMLLVRRSDTVQPRNRSASRGLYCSMVTGAFDEIMGHSGGSEPRPDLAALGRWLDTTPDAELRRRQEAAETTFRQLGITFAVYGDNDASERIIPFDIVPARVPARRMVAAVRRAGPARRCDQRVPRRYLRRTPHPGRGRAARRPDLRQSAVPARDRGHPAAARHLGAYLRDRSGPHRAQRLLRAGGQCAHAVGGQLHAGKPRGDAAAVPGTVPRIPRGGGRQLSRPVAGDDAVGRAARIGAESRSASC